MKCSRRSANTRTSTTVVNAYLSPVMGRYIERIDALFEEPGARQGRATSSPTAAWPPAWSCASARSTPSTSAPPPRPRPPRCVAQPFGIDNVITVDMGGTSFDITLSKAGRINFSKDTDFLRYRIGVPMIQVETLGAGGGSIAFLDDFGMLQVGPRSRGFNWAGALRQGRRRADGHRSPTWPSVTWPMARCLAAASAELPGGDRGDPQEDRRAPGHQAWSGRPPASSPWST